ncbi:MAG: CcoQ/FixQ family Cbb3-type cytochrome c oxidase assembly chaperone [Crocinitomicaceae bacterium]|jgi:cbb3-type cytochrome oxidase subunit 3|nr:CcoQ/FixQ family Cbb3-type cytochrome c oxidase assembly chaperone [Crocinitomicaceae bacterium]
MLRFIKHNLTGIDGVAIYPIISLLIFVLFFTVMLIYVLRLRKKEIDEISAIPLDLEKDELTDLQINTRF